MTLPAAPAAPVPAIEVADLRLRYRAGVLALDGIGFAVRRGSFLAILGPSGCGKSTLLRVLAGLSRASSGSVRRGGVALDRPGEDMGMVFQAPVLLPWLTVLENVLLPVRFRRRRVADFEDHARGLLARVGLEAFAGAYPYELSGGMQQRAAIVRALVQDPALLLMDEPFGALDAMTREQLNLELQRIWLGSGKTVVFVTHSIAEAVFLADTVMVMTPRPGRIAAMFEIDLPRPRRLEAINSDAFGAHANRIRQVLDSRSDLGA